MSNILIKRMQSNKCYPTFQSFDKALEYINRNIHDFNIHGEIVMVIDYDSGASKAYRVERTTKVVEIWYDWYSRRYRANQQV